MRGEGRSNEGLSTAPSSSLLMSPSTAPLARIDLERGTRPQNMHGVAHPAHPAKSLLVCVCLPIGMALKLTTKAYL